MTTTMDQFMRGLHGRIDSFEARMVTRMGSAHGPDITVLSHEVALLREDVCALAPSSAPIIPPMPVLAPLRSAFEVDLFADEESPMDRGKRPHSPKDQVDSAEDYEGDLQRMVKDYRMEYHASQIAEEQRARGASSSQAPPPPDAPSREPRGQTDDPTIGGPTFGA